MSDVLDQVKKDVTENKVVLYMKGSPEQPMCGFSARAVEILHHLGVKFLSRDVLSEPGLRSELPKFANWPTFPQLYVGGELVGGCDIMMEMFQNGELKKLIDQAEQNES